MVEPGKGDEAVKKERRISFEMKKVFTPQEITEMDHSFNFYDSNKDGTIHQTEFKQILADMGRKDISQEQLEEKFKEYDLDGDGVLNWEEFVEMFKSFKITQNDVFKQILQTKAGDIIQNVSESGFAHSYPIEEKLCYVKIINEEFKHDEDLKDMLPINEESDDIFSALQDGIMMCKLINQA